MNENSDGEEGSAVTFSIISAGDQALTALLSVSHLFVIVCRGRGLSFLLFKGRDPCYITFNSQYPLNCAHLITPEVSFMLLLLAAVAVKPLWRRHYCDISVQLYSFFHLFSVSVSPFSLWLWKSFFSWACPSLLLFHGDIAECTSLSYDTLRMVQSLCHAVGALMTELSACVQVLLHAHPPLPDCLLKK